MKILTKLLLLMAMGLTTSFGKAPLAERTDLISLYFSTDGANWTTQTNWGSGDPCDSNWYGVTCNASDTSVIGIALPQNNLNGSIPPQLGNLGSLRTLNLDYNQLAGSIIPPRLGNVGSLQTLSLIGNQLSGIIPPELGNLGNLKHLSLYNNQLSGTIPPALGNLGSLQLLYLYGNQLSGNIPAELGNLGSLGNLYLYDNQLSGTIPAELGNLTSLKRLRLANNQLICPLPPELGDLSLNDFNISYNNFTDISGLYSLDFTTSLDLTANCITDFTPVEHVTTVIGMSDQKTCHSYSNYDADGDGIADILWRHTNGQYLIFLMRADGSRKDSKYGYIISNDWQIQ